MNHSRLYLDLTRILSHSIVYYHTLYYTKKSVQIYVDALSAHLCTSLKKKQSIHYGDKRTLDPKDINVDEHQQIQKMKNVNEQQDQSFCCMASRSVFDGVLPPIELSPGLRAFGPHSILAGADDAY